MNKRIVSILMLVVLLATMMPLPANAQVIQEEPDVQVVSENMAEPKGSTVPMKAIVVIPGILGSTLKYGATTVWPGGGGDAYLALNENGSSVYTITSADGYGTLDIYEDLVTSLQSNFSSSGYDVIFFDYDWRKDNSYSATLLSSELASYSEVILIAHSMGGLIAAKFLDDSAANRAKTVALITMGTPFAGSAKAINAMETGELLEWPEGAYFREDLVKAIAQNSFAAYQLLPTTDYKTITSSYPVARNGSNGINCYSVLAGTTWGKTSSGGTKTQFNTAQTFHNALGHGTSHIIETSGVTLYTIAGSGTTTIRQVLLNADYTIAGVNTSTAGDGTVLQLSAGYGTPDKVFYNVKHDHLPMNSTVISYVVNLVSQETGVAVASTASELMDFDVEGYNPEDLVYNEKGWILGFDNRRITVITENDANVNVDGENVVILGQEVFTLDGVQIGNVWSLGDTGRMQFDLFDGNYSIDCTGQTIIKYMNDGYFEKVLEYDFGDDYATISISGYANDPVCVQNGVEHFPIRIYNEEELAELNQ